MSCRAPNDLVGPSNDLVGPLNDLVGPPNGLVMPPNEMSNVVTLQMLFLVAPCSGPNAVAPCSCPLQWPPVIAEKYHSPYPNVIYLNHGAMSYFEGQRHCPIKY